MASPPKPRPLTKATPVLLSNSTPASRTGRADQDTKAMPPPPNPLAPKPPILQPEILCLTRCLKSAVVKTGQIYSFFADTHKLGIEKHAPGPPRSLTASLGHEIEKYDQLCDSIESHLALLQRDLRREEQRLKAAETTRNQAEQAMLSMAASQADVASESEGSPRNGGVVQQPTAGSTPKQSPSVPLGRRSSAISISSLHRSAFPLKLDLSATSLRLTAEEASMFSSGLASPVTLAPKSARVVGSNEFPPELMAAFANASAEANNPSVDIGLTIANANEASGGEVKMGSPSAVGDSSDKPIELDLDSMDIDMSNMTDLFGDPADNGDSSSINASVDDLFSPIIGEPTDRKPGADTAEQRQKQDTTYLSELGVGQSAADIFASLSSNQDVSMTQPHKASDVGSGEPPESFPTTLLEDFASSNTNNDNTSSSNNISIPGDEAPFDLNSIDLSNLDPGFFSSSADADMNFPMDMEAFLSMGGENEEKVN